MCTLNTAKESQLRDQRTTMVEHQIRTWEVLDEKVLSLYRELPREQFTTQSLVELAYADTMLPCGEGQFMLEPKLEARMLQELQVLPHENVLHIGTGSGFFCALLSRLCKRVVSQEIRTDLANLARDRLTSLGEIDNVEIETCDSFSAISKRAPFDAIVATGSLPFIPTCLYKQLTMEGRLLAPVGDQPILTLRLEHCIGGNPYPTDILETWVPELDNAPQPKRFIF